MNYTNIFQVPSRRASKSNISIVYTIIELRKILEVSSAILDAFVSIFRGKLDLLGKQILACVENQRLA